MTGGMSRKKSVRLARGGGSVWEQGGEMETGKRASHPDRQRVWRQAEQTHPGPASGTTHVRPQMIRHQNRLPRLCLPKLRRVCQQLSYVSPPQGPALGSEKLCSRFCAKLREKTCCKPCGPHEDFLTRSGQ